MTRYTIGSRRYCTLSDLVAQGIEQGPSKPEVAGSNPAEVATYSCPCGIGEEPCPTADGQPACSLPSQESR